MHNFEIGDSVDLKDGSRVNGHITNSVGTIDANGHASFEYGISWPDGATTYHSDYFLIPAKGQLQGAYNHFYIDPTYQAFEDFCDSKPKCECGAIKAKSTHASWCDLFNP